MTQKQPTQARIVTRNETIQRRVTQGIDHSQGKRTRMKETDQDHSGPTMQ